MTFATSSGYLPGPEYRRPRSPAIRRTAATIFLAIATVGMTVLAASPAAASRALTRLVTDRPSTATPRVIGGDCYGKVKNPAACRDVLAITKVGKWIYVGGIISEVYDPRTARRVKGFHNLFRFNARTHRLDTRFKPQLWRRKSSLQAAEVTALAGAPKSHTIFVAGAFARVSSGPGKHGLLRPGLASFSTRTGAVRARFNARIGAGGGPTLVNDVKNVRGTLWIGGPFTHVGGAAQAALASVSEKTGAHTKAVRDAFAGRVTLNAPMKVNRMAINPQHTKAAVIGNFAQVDGATHKDVVLININRRTGASKGASRWNAPRYLDASQRNCRQDVWPRGVDWDPTGTYFDIAASGGGGRHPFPGLCSAFSRFAGNRNPHATPLIVNYTAEDSLLSVCDTGNYAYVGGHNKALNRAIYINGKQVRSREETHHGLGAISVNRHSRKFGRAMKLWNNTAVTGRGAGWGACWAVGGSPARGGGVYMGGDSHARNGNTSVKRLVYFPGS